MKNEIINGNHHTSTVFKSLLGSRSYTITVHNINKWIPDVFRSPQGYVNATVQQDSKVMSITTSRSLPPHFLVYRALVYFSQNKNDSRWNSRRTCAPQPTWSTGQVITLTSGGRLHNLNLWLYLHSLHRYTQI